MPDEFEEDDSVSEETIRRNLEAGFKPRRRRPRDRWHDRRSPVPTPPQRPQMAVILEWLNPLEELVYRRMGLTDMHQVTRWAKEWEATGLSVALVRAWFVAQADPWRPRIVADLQGVGIGPKLAFQKIKRNGEETNATIYGMVLSEAWSVEQAAEFVERAKAKKKEPA